MTRSGAARRRQLARRRAELLGRRSDLGLAVEELYRRLVTTYVVVAISVVALVFVVARASRLSG